MKVNIVAQIILVLTLGALGAWAQAETVTWKRGQVQGVAWDHDPKIIDETGWHYDARVLVLFAESGRDSVATYVYYFNTSVSSQVLLAERIFETAKESHAGDDPVWLNLDGAGLIRGISVGQIPSALARHAGSMPRNAKAAPGLAFRAPGRSELRDLLGRGLPAAGR